MLKNYFKTAWRNLSKNKFYSIVNISGLAVALAGFIIILLYLNYELSYNTWDKSLNNVYKISEQTDQDILQRTPALLASFLKQNSPEIQSATAINPSGDFKVLLSAGDNKIYQDGAVEADSLFFKVFPYKMLSGNASTALYEPNAIVIRKDVAQKLFGSIDAVGKTIRIYNAFDLKVTAVMAEPDKPSTMNVKFIYRAPYEKQNMFWDNLSYETYVKTNQPVDEARFETAINKIFYDQRIKKDAQTFDAFHKAHTAGLFADAFTNIHNFPKHGSSNFKTVSFLLLLAVLLLLAGSINFSNLSIAASMRRAKEVGLRKVMGSNRRQLVFQFIGEIALQCLISLVIAILLVNLLLPNFNRAFSITLTFLHTGKTSSIFAQIVLCLLIVIIFSGVYPAIFLSRYNITKVLKGDYSAGTKGASFRNVLIVIQFAVSAFFIIGTLVIHDQMNYMQSKDKGFSGEQVMRLQTTQQTRDDNFNFTRNSLLAIPGVEYVSKTTTVPGDDITDTSTVSYKCKGSSYRICSVKVSDDYFKTLKIALLKGRSFNNTYEDENTRSAVINEAAAKKLNLPNPVGTIITFPWCDSVPVQVIGVVKNFNVSGFENSVQPVVYTIGNKACMFQSGGAILVKINSKYLSQTVTALTQTWKKIEPDFPIQYSFLDENFEKLFATYQRLQVIIFFFAFTAIFISLTGLFAMTAFLMNRRTKEIGIRKILGAGISDIGVLLSKDFIRLIAIAVLLAVPLGWWTAEKWLQNFAYRTSLSWTIFAIAALAVLAISIITMSIHALKAAISNPVKSLRTE